MIQPRVLFYVQHLLGIGHLARASRIATALADDGFDILVVTGGAPVAGFPAPGLKTLTLPPVVSGDEGFSGLTDLNGNPVDDAFKEKRRQMLLQTVDDFQPDIVIIEAFPFGRRQMRFELIPLLEKVAALAPKPLLVASVRDILQERTKPGRNEETVDLVENFFDLVMVHGDPSFATIGQTFPLARVIESKVAYTGLVAAPPPAVTSEHFDVLVSAGGGAAGGDLVASALAAAGMLAGNLKWCLITGPNLPKPDFEAAVAGAPSNLTISRFRVDFASLLTGCRLSVSQAGYNTVCDVLRARCRSLLVPFAAGGETEQTFRAERLERMRLASVLTERDLTPPALAQAVERALTAASPDTPALDLDGAKGSAKVLRKLLKSSNLTIKPSRSA
ncbi:glycosyltransferase family protein [Neomesorhizobium albiziae]|uniref:glycosyltransferase family protein n=1 Tax=Neomesorhizobium albiziae TaxID=335020 RepID=UPI001FCEC692|nr:glycosyltransferase [Mesorhizobium albiziae]GLS33181.1 glycosyl transferase [Mesorhizobium albiziae]